MHFKAFKFPKTHFKTSKTQIFNHNSNSTAQFPINHNPAIKLH